MVTICLQCGDKGFSNALVYCVNCLEFAVHRYCLDKLPETFGEFVYWVCDDCEVEVPKEFSSPNSVRIHLENGDYMNSKHVEPSREGKSKKRKSGNMVLEAHCTCEDVPSELLYEVPAEIKLTKSALLASDCSPMELKKRACRVASPIAKPREMTPPRRSSVELDDMNNEVGSQHHQSSGVDVPRRKKSKKKINQKRAREFSSEISMQRLEYSPQEKPCQPNTKNNLNDHDESENLEKNQALPFEAENNRVLEAALCTCEDVPSEHSYEVAAEIQLTESALLASDCSPVEVKKRARHGASPIANPKGQTPPRRSSLDLDDMNNEVGSQHHQSPGGDVPRKTETKKKIKKRATGGCSSELSMQRLEYSPQEHPCQPNTKNNLNDHDDSAILEKKRACLLEAENKKHKKKKKKNKESARNFSILENLKPGTGCSLRPCESYAENNLNEQKESTELEKENASLSDAKMEYNVHQSSDVNAELQVTVTGNQVVEFSLLNKTNKKKRVVNTSSTDLQESPPENPRFGPDHLSRNVILYNYEFAQPLAEPIWRGSFNILNKEHDAFEGMVAHLSKKACQRAFEEARLFPTLLDLEMRPKIDVWPKSFKRSDPSDDSIALYFFPALQRYERMFHHLVEQMMDDELALRGILENAELLVFTSRELPLNYWRFRGDYYLWGVFRAKQAPSAQPSSNNHVGRLEGNPEHTEAEELGSVGPSQSLSNCSRS